MQETSGGLQIRPIDHNSRSSERMLRRAEIFVAIVAVIGVAIVLAGSDEANAAEPGGAAAAKDGAVTTTAAAEPPPSGAERAERAPKPRIRAAEVDRPRMILGARRGVAFRFELAGKRSRKVLVKVARVGSDKVRKRFRLGKVQPGQRQRIAWDGKAGKRGYIPQGKYAFRVYSDGQRAETGGGSGSSRFGFYKNRFPILGHHSYGDGFGAGRGHQGQDLFAKCGRPVVSAHAGRVQTRKYQSAAGYYVVVDGKGTGQDYAYMHMSSKGRPKEGSRVATGERIGSVNDTGRATGCHLHFEIWTQPGWYEGGRAKSPTRALKRWDKWS